MKNLLGKYIKTANNNNKKKSKIKNQIRGEHNNELHKNYKALFKQRN